MQVLIRGGGDLASGVALRLCRAGLQVLITELAEPLVVRRKVSFAEAIYEGMTIIEGVTACRVNRISELSSVFYRNEIPVIVDPDLRLTNEIVPAVLVDGRMIKQPPDYDLSITTFVIGLGPGFHVGLNCHAAIETNRGHRLGRVIWEDAPQKDTGIPESVMDHQSDRVLRAPRDGILLTHAEICDHLREGQLVAEVGGVPVYSPFAGVLRGIIHPGVRVRKNMKIGDVDPRDDPTFCNMVSDKSLAIAGGVLEAILSQQKLRNLMWS